MNLRHIVVATDESEAGRHAVRTGLDLAAKASARLTVMRVVSVKATGLLDPLSQELDPVGLDNGAMALERLHRWLEADWQAVPSDARVELGIALGVPSIEICRFAEQRAADLLVLGRKQRSPLARFLLGDTADAVLRRSTVPCLFVQPGSGPISRLLVALKGSDRGMNVLTTCRGFARATGAAIRVVTVESLAAAHPQSPSSPPPMARSIRLQHEVADAAIAVRQGTVVSEVLAEVSASCSDVLAFGYHRGGPPGTIEGSSTARQLAHTAPVSVLAIPL